MKRVVIALSILPLALLLSFLFDSVAAASTAIPGLAVCTSGPSCHYGPVHASYPNYKNVCSLDNCTFISAANWEQVVTGLSPSPSALVVAYNAAHQTFYGGLSLLDLWSFWMSSGIDGIYLTAETSYRVDRADVQSAVLDYRALVVVVTTTKPSYIGTNKFGSGTSILIVDGFTPKGPLVVFQGHTLQMTWAQWRAQVQSMWGVAFSRTPPTPVAPTSIAPTANFSLSSSSVLATGGTITLSYTSQNATSCTLSSSPTVWTTSTVQAQCSGSYQYVVSSSTTQRQWSFTFTASNSSNQSATSTQTLTQEASTLPADNPSSNWSGYVVPSSLALITDAQGQFSVPVLDCADTPNADSSIWIGIGGEQWSTGGSSGSLLQTGINADCVGGIQGNTAWWEVVPATPNFEQTFTGFPVSAGDVIQDDVSENSDGTWQTELDDLNTGLSAVMVTGESWGVSVTAQALSWTPQGSAANISYAGAYTAEWIVEDDTNSSTLGLNPFANFGSVTFIDLRSSFTSWSLTQNETWAIVQNGQVLSTPSSSSTDGFTVSYEGP
jgi:hypothetical protein